MLQICNNYSRYIALKYTSFEEKVFPSWVENVIIRQCMTCLHSHHWNPQCGTAPILLAVFNCHICQTKCLKAERIISQAVPHYGLCIGCFTVHTNCCCNCCGLVARCKHSHFAVSTGHLQWLNESTKLWQLSPRQCYAL